MARKLESKQTNATVILSVKTFMLWDRLREYAIANNLSLSEVVEKAVAAFLFTVRRPNT